jgi:hypothetical protein
MTDTPALEQQTIVPIGAPEAPIIYFDECTNFGCNHGIVNTTLVAAVYTPQADGQIGVKFVVQAHLRMRIQAAIGLREALNKAVAIGMPTESAQH